MFCRRWQNQSNKNHNILSGFTLWINEMNGNNKRWGGRTDNALSYYLWNGKCYVKVLLE